MEPVEFIAVKEEDSLQIDDFRIDNCLPFDPFEAEEKKQELTDALKYCVDVLKDAQIISDLQSSNGTISRRSQLMGEEIRRRIMDMLYFMKFTEDEEVVDCTDVSVSHSLDNSSDLNGKESRNDSTKSVEKDASILNQPLENVDEDQCNGLDNYGNSVKTEKNIKDISNKMSRKRALKKEERKMWDAKLMEQAITCVRTKRLGYTRAANLFDVPRTTLRRLVATDLSSEECVNMRIGRKPIIPPEMEAELVEYLVTMENKYFGLTSSDVKKMAYQLAERNKLKHPFGQNEEAGRAWFNQFIKRHSNLNIHKSNDTSDPRAISFNRDSISAFYKILDNVYKEHNYNADRIFNVDETGFFIVQNKVPRVVGLKGNKQVGSLTAAEKRSFITVIYSMSAGGTFIPPMLIFSCDSMTDNLMKGAPGGAIGRCHPSGWVQTDLFTEWFEHFIKITNPTKESPILLIFDGHYTHTRSLDIIDLARKNYVTILSIPPLTTHEMQPLNRTFVGPFKQYFGAYVNNWQRENERLVDQCDIAESLGKAYLHCQSNLIAANGFEITGIYPFNPYIVLDSNFIASIPLENRTNATLPIREIYFITEQHDYQIEEDLAQPGCSKNSEEQNSMIIPVSPKDISPVPQIESKKSSQVAILTDSSNQETLQSPLKSTKKTKKCTKKSISPRKNVKKRGRKRKIENDNNVDEECNNSFINSELEFPPVEIVPAKNDVNCMYCNQSFLEDLNGGTWIQCVICEMWAHVACTGAEKDDYICDFCK